MNHEKERKDTLAYHLDLHRVDLMYLNKNLIDAIESYAQRKADKQCVIKPKEYNALKKQVDSQNESLKHKREIIRKLKAELKELGGYHIAAKII